MHVGMTFVALLAAQVPTGSPAATDKPEPPPQTRTLSMSAADMFGLARAAQQSGDLSTAMSIYRALEQDRDSDVRANARFLLAEQLAQSNRHREAAILLRRLVDERPDAAAARLQLAQLLHRLGDTDGAWREMRAVQSGRLPAAIVPLIERYENLLRTARPRGASLEIAIAPDSNINRATRSDTLGTILGDFEIDPASKAESGIGLSLRGQAYRRLAMREDLSLVARASASANIYAKQRFNDIALDVAVGPEFHLGRNRIALETGATSRWFGQAPFVRSLRIAGSWTRPLRARSQLRVGGSASLVDNRLNRLQDGKSFAGFASLDHALSPTTAIGLSLSGDRMSARDPGYSLTGWRLGLSASRQVGRTALFAGAETGRLRADERLLLFPERRSDRLTRLTIGTTLRKYALGGFAPTSRLTIERNKSNIAFYDYSRTRTEVGITRAF